MIEHEFPPKLTERCMERAAMRHAVVKAASGDDVDAWTAGVVAVLRESGHADLVAALKGARGYVHDEVVNGKVSAKTLMARIEDALRKAGAL